MMGLDDIRRDKDIVNAIDWEMTPEEAVTRYLEWGNNWSHGEMIKSKNDVSHYFVVYNWDANPRILLIKRNSDEAVELASIDMPMQLKTSFLESVNNNKGVYAVSGEVKEWLENQLH